MRSFANSVIILRPSQRERAIRVYGPCLGGTLRALRHLDMKFSPSDLGDDYDENPPIRTAVKREPNDRMTSAQYNGPHCLRITLPIASAYAHIAAFPLQCRFRLDALCGRQTGQRPDAGHARCQRSSRRAPRFTGSREQRPQSAGLGFTECKSSTGKAGKGTCVQRRTGQANRGRTTHETGQPWGLLASKPDEQSAEQLTGRRQKEGGFSWDDARWQMTTARATDRVAVRARSCLGRLSGPVAALCPSSAFLLARTNCFFAKSGKQ
jgi:hypothetical protein